MSRAADLAEFVRNRRERLDPVSLGFEKGRRRTPGLRREEVALLARVSASWYTWVEQGRDIHMSEGALERLSRALQFNEAEREHLFLLAHDRPPPKLPAASTQLQDSLIHLLAVLEPTPAYVRTSRLDILAWNDAARRTFVDWETLAPHERNSMRLLFLYPPYRDLIDNWDEIAERTVATFRAAQARAADPAPFQALADELYEADSRFRTIWETQAVQSFGEGRKRLCHPEYGPLDFDHVSLIVEGQPDLRVVAFVQPRANGTYPKQGQFLLG